MIQNLLFDLGGVIMDIKKDHCVDAFKTLGLPDASHFFGDYGQKGPFREIEEGLISPAQFHAFMRGLIPFEVTDRQIDDAFMKFLIGIPIERLRQLQLLRQHYGIYLLSNTNLIMWNAKIAEEFRKDGLEIDGYFDGIVTSFEAKALKPSPQIFQYAVDHLHIVPSETIFLDDSKDNIDAAIALGFRGLHVPDGEEFYDLLKAQGLS